MTMAAPLSDDVASGPTRSHRGPGIARVEVATLLLLLAAGAVALVVGVRARGYDYDEVTRAHSAWLAAQGLRPYSDFFECHPPYFALLVPIVRLCPDPTDLLGALRIFGVLGNLLFLAGLAALGATTPVGRRWAWLVTLVVACNPAILDYLIEFRIDGWGYALLAWGLVRFRRSARRPRRDFEFALLTGLAALVFSPKLVLLPPLVVMLDLLKDWRSPRAVIRRMTASATGSTLAASLVATSLWWQGIAFGDVFQLLVRYHAIGGTTSGFRLGLLSGILDHRALAGATLAGLVAWAAHRIALRSWPDACEVALAAWLGLQVAAVAYPYKQYYAPWFLFASTFVVFVGTVPMRRLRTLALIAAGATAYAALDAARSWSRDDEAGRHRALIRWMNRVASPEDRVVASPPLHPIARHDTFFLWFNTSDPNGFDSERILGRLPTFRGRVALDYFRRELDEHPPALVALSGDWRMVAYPEGEQQALAGFLARRGYRVVPFADCRFAIRPDRLDVARRAGPND